MKGLLNVVVAVAVCTAMVCCAADMKKVPNPRLARGLNAEIAKKFSNDYKTFTCDNGATVLPADSVNDDYCDCADNSDEYGTNACPKGTFYCRNKYYQPSTLPSGQLDDGVCDCCDGSDEPKGMCKNTCKEKGAERRKAVFQRKTDVETGLKKRDEMAKQGAKVLEEKKKELVQLKAAIEAKTPERDKATLDFDEKSDAFKKKDDYYRKLQDERREKREKEEAEKAEREKAEREEAERVERERLEREGHPIETDGGADINEMVHGGLKQELGEPLVFAPKDDMEHAQPAHLDPEPGHEHEHEEDDDIKPENDPKWVALKDAKEEARKVMNTVVSELRELEEKKVEAERILEMNVGGDMCLVQLGTECHELHEKFTYKICPLKNAKQDGNDLGRFKSWEGDESLPLAKRQMKFDDGSHCWDGPNRNTLVTFRCGAEPRVISVSEPSRCTYTVTMESPCACSQEDLDEAVANINAMLADEAED